MNLIGAVRSVSASRDPASPMGPWTIDVNDPREIISSVGRS